jgi:hypothetical protein
MEQPGQAETFIKLYSVQKLAEFLSQHMSNLSFMEQPGQVET